MPPPYGELLDAAAPIARLVLAALLLMSLAAASVAFDRWRALRTAERASRIFLERWRRERSTDPALLAAKYQASPIARLVTLAARAWESTDGTEARWNVVEHVVRRHLIVTGVELRRRLAIVATVGFTAPFVGLFGTVVGIIDAIGAGDATPSPGAVSTGLAEALIATALGIMVAIPAIWAFNLLTQRIGTLLAALECASEEFAIGQLQAPRQYPGWSAR